MSDEITDQLNNLTDSIPSVDDLTNSIPSVDDLIGGVPKINCSTNSILDSVNAKKEELLSKVKGLTETGGAGAIADLKAQADSMKESILGMIPELPEVPNFQKELSALQSLKGDALAQASALLKDRWGDAIPNIDGITSNVLSGAIDICSGEVPNVDALNIDAVTGKVTSSKEKGPLPTTPIEIPKKSEPLVPTVVQQEKEPSSTSASGFTMSTYDARQKHQKFVEDANSLMKKKAKEISPYKKHWAKIKSSNKWQKMSKRRERAKYNTSSEYYNSGTATAADKALIEEAFEGYNDHHLAIAERVYMGKLFRHFEEAYDDESWNSYDKIVATGGSFYTNSGGSISLTQRPTISESERQGVLDSVLEIANKYKDDVITWNRYRLNIEN
jgi:hypothetical protein